MDIGSGKGYPSSALSNFSPHKFTLDEIEISSMEGFLQSLKFKSVEMQKEVCKLVGFAAKKRGYGKNENVLLQKRGEEVMKLLQSYGLIDSSFTVKDLVWEGKKRSVEEFKKVFNSPEVQKSFIDMLKKVRNTIVY